MDDFIRLYEEKIRIIRGLLFYNDSDLYFYKNLPEALLELSELVNLMRNLGMQYDYSTPYSESNLIIALKFQAINLSYIKLSQSVYLKFDEIKSNLKYSIANPEWDMITIDFYESYRNRDKLYHFITDIEKPIIGNIFNIKESPVDNYKLAKPKIKEYDSDYMYAYIEKINTIFGIIFSEGEDYIKVNRLINAPGLSDCLENYLKKYCQENKNKVYKDLKNEIRKLKSKPNESQSPDLWGKLALQEDNTLKEVANSGDDSKGIASMSYFLLNRCFYDTALFDIDYAISNGLFKVINYYNQEYFLLHVLKRNIIQCEMFPHLKPQFEAWLNDEEPAEPSVSETEDKGPLFTPQAMALWGKLQKAGLVDEELQPKVSMRKASMIAKIMGESLGLNPLWQPFEELWNAKNLSKAYYFASVSEYKDSLPEKINKALNIS